MKTEQEIRERIATHRQVATDEELDGRIGGEDWSHAMMAEGELRWVLGE